MKKIISYFIKYPIGVNIIIIAFAIFGILGYKSLTSSFFPLSESNIIIITTNYPGASPQEMEEGVVLKIEDNLKGLEGIDRVTSKSSENAAVITVETFREYDVDIILADVKNAVDKVPSFPSGMEPPIIAIQEASRETISFVVNGKNVNLITLKQKAQQIEKELRLIDGISMVTLSGYPDEEIEIAVREADMRAFNLSFTQVANAVANNAILTTGGSIKTEEEEYLIRASHRAYYATELNEIVVKADKNGNIIRLKDVAEIRDRFNDTPNSLAFNGNNSVRIVINNTNSEDLITTADNVKEYIANYNKNNEEIELAVISDSSITLNQRTELLLKNAWQGMLMVLIILSLFLKPRLAFWVAFGIPVSFLGMFTFAGQFDVTINVLSLFGMIIVIGILVDDGIVIAENIYAHYEKGKTPIRAAIDGTIEVIPPIFSAVVTTILAFATFLYLDGRLGQFFGEVSIIVLLTLGISLLEAMVILPAHIAHSKALNRDAKTYGFNRVAEKVMVYLRDTLYVPVLNFTVKNRFISLTVLIALFLITVGGISGGIIRTTFFPEIASDRISISLTMPQGTNVNTTDSIISVIEEKAWEVNEKYKGIQSTGDSVILNIIKTIGPGSATAKLDINLLQGELREFSAPDLTKEIQDLSGEFYGVEALAFGSGSQFGGSPVSISLLGNNVLELKSAKNELKSAMLQMEGLKDIADNDPEGIKEIKIDLKPNAYLLGLTMNDVMFQVRSAFFGNQVQRFQRGQDEIKIWVRYLESERTSIKNLDDMRILTSSGDRIPFSEIAEYTIERGEITINHLEGQREIQVSADMENSKASATDFMNNIKTAILPGIFAKHPSVSATYEGQNREASKVIDSAKVVFPIILLLIYFVIAFTFRSYSQPIILLIMVPFSLIGVGWGHYIHDFPINILSMLGIIALIGIMVNDGLVLISKFNINLKEGMKFDEALVEAGKSRFRAIFLTTITTIAGLAPLIFFEKSLQAQFLIPMAISIAYGIAIATVLTLILLPILLSYTNGFKVNMVHFWEGKRPTHEAVERAVKEIEAEKEH
ncbi:AcrB/AcrD/AcrF family protein [Putridiphycobacter roseus]|uniref:AcrB/AcrD/AcrF family protein n=1 Tax=Putridiphycobacter roseus TaxID=2219161 RepID=A0A2W1N4T2_9FLAO|nr:efflux RND transporter permease subunit [Putridiphycobacter roseus]PZE18101.1 AcrB/AcrD/AcrF family protein [Putridiphycobacter roseus]